jgi:hypothetical protein
MHGKISPSGCSAQLDQRCARAEVRLQRPAPRRAQGSPARRTHGAREDSRVARASGRGRARQYSGHVHATHLTSVGARPGSSKAEVCIPRARRAWAQFRVKARYDVLKFERSAMDIKIMTRASRLSRHPSRACSAWPGFLVCTCCRDGRGSASGHVALGADCVRQRRGPAKTDAGGNSCRAGRRAPRASLRRGGGVRTCGGAP